jgi:hypothetical protein
MMTGPLLTAVAIVLISCTFLDKSLYIVTVFLSNVLFGLGLGCYATLNGYGGSQRAGEQSGRRLGDLQDGQLAGRGDGHCGDSVTFCAVFTARHGQRRPVCAVV